MRRIQMRRTGSGRHTNAGLLSFTWFYLVLLGFTRLYSVLLGFTRFTLFSINQVKVNKRDECKSVLLGFTQ